MMHNSDNPPKKYLTIKYKGKQFTIPEGCGNIEFSFGGYRSTEHSFIGNSKQFMDMLYESINNTPRYKLSEIDKIVYSLPKTFLPTSNEE